METRSPARCRSRSWHRPFLLASVRVIDRRTRGAGELRRTFWISLGAVLPLFFGHFAQVGLWAGFLVTLGALKTYVDAFYFSLVTFATLGYGDIALAPGYRIFGALGATCGSLMLGWSTALIFAAISRGVARPADPQGAADAAVVADRG
ncbi:MAG: two pore domain potassium channel family protein [Alphaproteobacteria bacterium]|nr:two pore domain potassium channel family protein [Alphaproteobacteria bacterium]MBV8335510.1 two pore domain potassium channel family protein [Alphaproteobacteria bacterium]